MNNECNHKQVKHFSSLPRSTDVYWTWRGIWRWWCIDQGPEAHLHSRQGNKSSCYRVFSTIWFHYQRGSALELILDTPFNISGQVDVLKIWVGQVGIVYSWLKIARHFHLSPSQQMLKSTNCPEWNASAGKTNCAKTTKECRKHSAWIISTSCLRQ